MVLGTQLRFVKTDLFPEEMALPVVHAAFLRLFISLDDQLTSPFFQVSFVSPVFLDEALADG